MRICLDYRPALHQGTGVGTYVHGLVSALSREHAEVELTAFSASWRHRLDSIPDADVRIVDARVPVRLLDWLWHRRRWPPVEHWVGEVDVAHSPSPMLLPTRHARRVVTVHDCYYLRHPEDVSGPVQRDYVPLTRSSLEAADAVITVSETTRDEIVELFSLAPERLHVTPLGIDPVYLRPPRPETTRALLRQLDVPEPYLLFVGRREPRKDMPTLLAAFDRLLDLLPAGNFPHLLLVGPPGPRWERDWEAATARVRARSRCLPHQPARRLVHLYAGADALLLPSRWEGFGLTAVEAQALGTPVIAARAGALPEVLGNTARWIEPGDAAGLAVACGEVLGDPDVAASLGEA
ncbi:MAG: glycosyltransferase family 4 protein, partial [Acidobacteriota bacterium]